MRVLITGASGFLGRHVTAAFVMAGHDVIGIGRHPRDKARISTDIDYHQVDLLSLKNLTSLFKNLNVDTLIHLAWDVTPGYWSSLNNLDWLAAGITLYRSAVEGGVGRIVTAGTCAEYDWGRSEYLSPETTPLTLATLYGKTKNALRDITESASAITGISLAWGRLFLPYGPYESQERLVPAVINSLLQKKIAQCTYGVQERDFIFASDVAKAFVTLAESNYCGSVNIASGECHKVKDIVNILIDIIGGNVEFGAIPTRDNEPPRLAADVSHLRSLGFQCSTDLRKGLEITVEWWRQQKQHS